MNNLQTKSLISDIKEVVDYYESNGFGDDDTRSICLQQLEAIMPHQCGDHYKCKHERQCTFLKAQQMHPTWTDDKIAEEAAIISSRPHGGKI